MTGTLTHPDHGAGPELAPGPGGDIAPVAAPPPAGPVPRRGALAREQGVAAAAQLAAGAGNLAFVAVVARGLDARAFAELATFVALYLVAHVPGAAIAAAGAVGGTARQVWWERGLGASLAVATWVLAGPLGRLLHVRPGLVVLLGLALVAGPSVAGERGRRYAAGDVRGVGASLVAEPATRLLLGLPLAWAFGAVGGAIGVVAGGWVAAAVLFRQARRRPVSAGPPHHDAGRRGPAAATAAAFILLAVLQNLDLVLANRLLPASEAAHFAILSTLGGLVAFATATVPMVLLPRARQGGDSAALRTALAAAAALGGGAALAAVVAPAALFTALFGSHGDVAAVLPPYLLAMAALGLARVLAAHRCAGHGRRATVAAVTLAIVVQASLITQAETAAGVARATLVAALLLLATLAAVPRLVPALVGVTGWVAPRFRRSDVRIVVGLTAVALVLRLAVDRGLWVDEAISVDLARRPFGAMLDQLRANDVHPPLHAVILWLTVRVAGASELAVRLPSVVAGTALVPALWLAGRSLYDRRTGLVAAALGAVAPLLVWYSQEARMYALFMLLATVAVWAQVEAVRRGRAVHWVAYAAATAALLWTQYFSVLVVAVQQAGFAVVVVRTWRARDRATTRRIVKGWALSMGAVAAALLPLLPFAAEQLASYSDRRGATVPSTAGTGATTSVSVLSVYAVLANAVWALVGFHGDRTMAQIVAMWPLAMLLALVVLGRRRSGATTLLLAVAAVPAAVLFVVGLEKRDLFELRYFAAAAPVGVLLVSRLITLLAPGRVAVRAATALAVALLAVGLVDQQLNGANPRLYDFRGALGEIRARAEPGDTVVYAPSYLASVVDYYGHGMAAQPLGSEPPPEGVFVVATFRTIAQRDTAASVGTQLSQLERDHKLVDRFERANVRVWEFR